MSDAPNSNETYAPRPGETLGQYVKRLREEAGKRSETAQTSQAMVATLSQQLPSPYRFSASWLSGLEADHYELPSTDRLRALASIYSELLDSPIAYEWLLEKAGYEKIALPLTARDLHYNQLLSDFLKQEEVLTMTFLVGRLQELGFHDDIRWLINIAARLLQTRSVQEGDKEKEAVDDLLDDPVLSSIIKKFIGDQES